MLKVEKDFEEFVELLNKFSVEYMIVGAYALALYSRPRNTGDIDVFINSSSKSAKQIIKVIEEFGFEMPMFRELDNIVKNDESVYKLIESFLGTVNTLYFFSEGRT